MFTLAVKGTHKSYPHKNLYKKAEVDIIVSQAEARGREELLSELDIVWVCPSCAKQFFGRGYVEGKTNISTAVHRQCEACHQYNQCMHYRSYDNPKSDLLTKIKEEHE